jgi:hypothetical protein
MARKHMKLEKRSYVYFASQAGLQKGIIRSCGDAKTRFHGIGTVITLVNSVEALRLA